MAPPKTKDAPRGTVHGSLYNGVVTYTIRAVPLPQPITDFLLSHASSIAGLLAQHTGGMAEDDGEDGTDGSRTDEGVAEAKRLTPEEFWSRLAELCRTAGGDWVGAADRIWSFGPKRVGANLLLDPVGKTSLRRVCAFRERRQS